MKKETLFLILTLVIALFLRIYKLDKIPPGLNRDEASIGYTAYSILKTGKDEYGNFLPLSFKSFGDWKLPLYVYLDIPFVALLGLSEFAVRLPSALFGIITVLGTYLLARQLFPNLMANYYLLITLLLGISQWHLHFSRVAYEANIALFLSVWGVWLFLKGLRKDHYLIVSSFLLGLTFYTYHSCHIFTPLLVLGLLIIFWRLIKKNKYLTTSTFIFLFLALSAYKINLFKADIVKISGIGFFTDKVAIHNKIEQERMFHKDPNNFLARILHNRPLFFGKTFLENYLRGYSPEFLFIKGGGNPQHNIPEFGNLNPFLAPFLAVGAVYLVKNFSSSSGLIFWWLFSSGVAPALTRDAPHSARMLSSLPTWQIISTLGVVNIVQWIAKPTNRFKWLMQLLFTFYFLLFLFYFFSYLDGYFLHFPQKSSGVWNFGLKDVTFFVKEREDQYKNIIMTRPSYSPYVFFLFYQKYDPEKFQKEAKRYPLTDEGFHHVRSFGKYQFIEKINWDSLQKGNLYIDWADSVPSSFIPKKTFYLLNGKPIYKLIEG